MSIMSRLCGLCGLLERRVALTEVIPPPNQDRCLPGPCRAGAARSLWDLDGNDGGVEMVDDSDVGSKG